MKEGSIDEKYFNVSFSYQFTDRVMRENKIYKRSFLRNDSIFYSKYIFIISDDPWSPIIEVKQKFCDGIFLRKTI